MKLNAKRFDEFQRLAQEYLPYIHLINPYLWLRSVAFKVTALGGHSGTSYELKVAE